MFARFVFATLLVAGLAIADSTRTFYHVETEEEEVNENKKYPLGDVYCAYLCKRPKHASHDDCDTSCDYHMHSPEKTIKLTQQQAEEFAKTFVKEFTQAESTETNVSAGVTVAPPEATGGVGASLGGSASRKNEASGSTKTENSVKITSTITIETELKPSVHHEEPCTTKRAKWGVQVSVQGRIVKKVLRGYVEEVRGKHWSQSVAPEKVVSISGELTVFVTLYQDEPTSSVACNCRRHGGPGKPVEDGSGGNDGEDGTIKDGQGGKSGAGDCPTGENGKGAKEEKKGSSLRTPENKTVVIVDAVRRFTPDATTIDFRGASVYTFPQSGFNPQAWAAARIERMQQTTLMPPPGRSDGCNGARLR